jgi:hypothetical protein
LGEVANVHDGLFYDGVVYCMAHTQLFSIVILNSQPNASGELRPIGREPEMSTEPALWAVSTTGMFGAGIGNGAAPWP